MWCSVVGGFIMFGNEDSTCGLWEMLSMINQPSHSFSRRTMLLLSAQIPLTFPRTPSLLVVKMIRNELGIVLLQSVCPLRNTKVTLHLMPIIQRNCLPLSWSNTSRRSD
ncbi:hypothetical protein MtrunA17_Chr5g0429071 [Medicago truncatula]|uniref:Uncharacterized protein n=1 Tax=Medicago truncatula TaxID=3880 RepID=A0A396HSR7_MEDTR|nr:hypothetical protein MtrunA17_Chr5g0429071 [Medicago truncatula]